MISLLILGLVLAISVFLVYITRSWTSAQKDKATLEISSKMALERNRAVENDYLRTETQLRTTEAQNVPPEPPETVHSTVNFYPERLRKRDEDLN